MNNVKMYDTGLLMGVFDLFHVGHLRLIRRAKEQSSYLRVGVLSDELMVKFKNKSPVIPLSERMEILAAIREVDEVVAIKMILHDFWNGIADPLTVFSLVMTTAAIPIGNGNVKNCEKEDQISFSSRIQKNRVQRTLERRLD